MTLPNFLIIGSQKSGTTSLHDILSTHPQINMSDIKEINFFTNAQKYKKGLNYYSSFFQKPSEIQIVTGESSPGYICTPGVAEKIQKDLGLIKIVIILRDPIKRAFSQYWDNRRHLSESLTIDEAIDRYLNDRYVPGARGYFSRGVYINYIEKYDLLFGRKKIYVLILEELINRPKEKLNNLYKFLDIDPNLGLQGRVCNLLPFQPGVFCAA